MSSALVLGRRAMSLGMLRMLHSEGRGPHAAARSVGAQVLVLIIAANSGLYARSRLPIGQAPAWASPAAGRSLLVGACVTSYVLTSGFDVVSENRQRVRAAVDCLSRAMVKHGYLDYPITMVARLLQPIDLHDPVGQLQPLTLLNQISGHGGDIVHRSVNEGARGIVCNDILQQWLRVA